MERNHTGLDSTQFLPNFQLFLCRYHHNDQKTQMKVQRANKTRVEEQGTKICCHIMEVWNLKTHKTNQCYKIAIR